MIFGVTIWLPGTGGEGYNRASYFMKHIVQTMEYTYNLIFDAGPTYNIEISSNAIGVTPEDPQVGTVIVECEEDGYTPGYTDETA